ncbi:LPS export ABC transporter periplasmic protein LptC [Ferrigenium sp. UT5]|uniref:LPS export ABC transporter periplasmic protein LptC n=1 Tax=Ferrigenium sp. UT5 TaxID=3242105 RepID=UPI00354E6E19
MSRHTLTDRLRAWLPLAPLLLLLLGSYWLSLQVQPLPPASAELRHEVDFVVERVRSTVLDPQGKPHFVISTEKMWHFPDDDSTHLQQPHLTRYFSDRPPTEISALRGMLSSRGEDVFLQDGVEVLQRGENAGRERRLQTEYLHVQPDRGWAETDQPVRVLDRHNLIDAVGMELDEQARTVKLLQHVRGRHEPVRP